MAIEYHLLTWAGLGTTVTFTDAGDIVNFTAHGAPNGHAFQFPNNAGNTLPTGLSKDTTYYLRQGADANKFTIHPTSADAIAGTNQVTFSGTGSGTHQVVGAYWAMLPKTDPGGGGNYRDRYYSSASLSYQVYKGHKAWIAGVRARTDQLVAIEATVEIEGVWDDSIAPDGTANPTLYSIFFTTLLNGVRGTSFHNGVFTGGWRRICSYAGAIFNLTSARVSVDGLEIINTNAAGVCIAIGSAAASCTVKNNLVTSAYRGISEAGQANKIYNNVITGCSSIGFVPGATAGVDSIIYNNTIVNNSGSGFSMVSANSYSGCIFNNVSVGNGTNWGTAPNASFIAFNNGGISSDAPWNTLSTDTSIKTLTADDDTFHNYAGSDFRPSGDSTNHTSTSNLVDIGVVWSGVVSLDIKDNIRPSYKNGSSTAWDIGAFEFDWGYGEVPNFKNFTITGLISGSRVKIKKTSDGTQIYNDVVNATSLTISYNAGAADTPVTIDIAKGAAAPFYYRYRTTSSISYLSDSGVSVAQIPDIARGATYPAGVSTDWAVNTGTKAITNASGTTIYTLQDLYSWLTDYYDHADRVDLDMPMQGITPQQFRLINSGTISDSDMELLNSGSLWLADGTTLWANVTVVGTIAASTPLYIHVDGSPYTAYWGNGNIDVLLKLSGYDGTEVVDVRAHKYTDTYDHWSFADGLAEGINVAAIATTDDPNNQTAEATVNAAPYTSITVTVDNPTDKAIDAADTPADYTTTIDAAGLTVLQVYERLKYLTKSPSTYVSANSGYAEVKASPYGTYAGGVLFGARGIWIENVAAADALNYILTDNDGNTHQAAAPPVQISVTNIVAGSTIQVYDITNSTQLDVDTVAGTTYALEKTWTEDLDIRIRLMHVDGVTAYEFFEGQGVFSATGMSLRANQVLDTIYNTNAIDGSTVTGVSIDDDNLLVEVDTGSISWQQLYAYETYWLSTEAGIVDEGRFCVAPDVANYLWYDFKIKNVSSPAAPLTVTGGFGRDGDTGTALAMIDTSGGSIFFAPDHVVPYSSGAEATVAIVQAGLTAQGFTTSRAPKLDDISADGGLTPEQAAQLSSTLTVGKFIALK